MHAAVRTIPRAVPRPPAVLLAAVVLALLGVLGGAGALTDAPPPRGVAAAVAAPGHGAPHADDGCAADCAVRAATRPESPGEHPAPRGHFTAYAKGAALPAPRQDRRPMPTAHLAFADPHAPRADRGRAPPAPSGI